MNVNLPSGLSKNLMIELNELSNMPAEMTAIDEKIAQTVNKSPEKLIDFLSACLTDKSYLKQHEDLAKKLLKRADKFFVKQKFSKEQRINILTIIRSSEFALKHAPSLQFKQKSEDISLKQESENISLNRICAVAQSPFFQAQATSPLKLDRDKINASDISPDSLNLIFEFLKTGTLPVLMNAGIIQEIIEKADKWQITDLAKKLPEQCPIAPENALAIYQSANRHSQDELKNHAFAFLTNQTYDVDEIVELYQISKSENLHELALFCQNYLFDVLAKLEKVKESSSEDDKMINKAGKILKNLSFFSKEHLTTLSVSQLMIVFKFFPEHIQALVLSVYTDDEIELLAQHLPPYIEELNLSGTTLSGKTIKAVVLRCRLLKILDLSNAVKWNKENPEKFDEEDWEFFAGLGHLTHFNMTNCPGALPIIKLIIIQSPNLKELKMTMPTISDKGSDEPDYIDLLRLNDQCAYLLGKCCSELKTLEMSYLSSKGIDFLSFNKEIMQNLTSLTLSNFQKYLPNSQKLIYPNKFDLISLGTKFPNLKYLKLTDILYDDEAYQSLGNLNQLEELEIKTSNYNVDPLLHFGNCSNLRKISINGVASNKAFEHLISNCPNLTKLKLTEINSYQLDILLNSKIDLKELELDYDFFTIPDWNKQNMLLAISSRFPDLNRLSWPLFNEEISKETFHKAFLNWSQLKELTVYVDKDNEKLLKSLKNCKELESLSIKTPHQIFGSDFLSEFISELSELKKLKSLSCTMNCKAVDISSIINKLPNLENIFFNSIQGSIEPIINEIISTKLPLNTLYLMSAEKYNFESLSKLIQNTNLKSLVLPRLNLMRKIDMDAIRNILLSKYNRLTFFGIYSNTLQILYKLSREKEAWHSTY